MRSAPLHVLLSSIILASCAPSHPCPCEAQSRSLAQDPAFIEAVAAAVAEAEARRLEETQAREAPVERGGAGPFDPEEIRTAFSAALDGRGLAATILEVDVSEAPPLIFGVIDGTRDYRQLHDLAREMGPPYQHAGAVTFGDGKSRMAFALGVVPMPAVSPQAQLRVRARLEALAGRAREGL